MKKSRKHSSLKIKRTNNILQNSIFRSAIGTGCILLIPLVAMQFSREWNWDLFDFIFIGILLFCSGLVYELLARKTNNTAYRIAVGVAVVTAVLLVWVNAAVGIIGDGDNLSSILYLCVLGVSVAGALIARFKPLGMMRTLFVTAFAQAVVPVTALIVGQPSIALWGEPGIVGVFILNSCFVALWVGSALLFLRASK